MQKVLLCLLLWGAAAPGAELFEESDVMIPMRDGVKLHTVIFAPKERSGAWPCQSSLNETPCGIPSDERAATYSLESLLEDGYILAFQDIRGRFKSEGSFVMLRPPRDRTAPNSIDESTDTYDSIDWMVCDRSAH